MAFKKGHDPKRNTEGRPKGKPNRTTEEVRQLLQTFIEANMEDLQAQYEQLEPAQKLNFFEKLLKHCLPSPLHELEKLTDQQLDELIERLKEQQKTNLR